MEKKIIGTWQCRDSTTNSDGNINYVNTKLVLKKNFEYTIDVFGRNQSSSTHGRYSIGEQDSLLIFSEQTTDTVLDKKLLLFSNTVFKRDSLNNILRNQQKVQLLNDTMLMLNFKQEGIDYFIKYKKLYDDSKNASHSLYLVNSLDSKKVIDLHDYSEILFFLKTKTDSNLIFNEHCFDVVDIELKDSVVHCNVYNEYQKMYLKNGGEYSKDISYYDFSISDTLPGKYEKTFNSSSIESIKYKSVLVNNARFFGSTINVLSIFSALVVAPLISANFRQGEFNSRIYFKTVGWSAVGLSVGIPLSTLKIKKYKLVPKGSKKDLEYWYLENLVVE